MKPISDVPFISRVEQTIQDFHMIQPGGAVLIGVSGGPDSVALLYALNALSDHFDIRLGIAHMNHGLRGKRSEQDAEFVESLAINLNLPYDIQNTDVRQYSRIHRLSLEEAGRILRYRFFDDIARQRGYHKIAVGHHADDLAEMTLMNLIRGSGLKGISGIPPVRDGKIIRPLIRTRRSEIMDFLIRNQWEYVVDESNTDITFIRNRMRHQVIPLLQSCNPNVVETINRFSHIIATEDEWIEELITPIFQASLVSQNDNSLTFSISQFQMLPMAAKRRILRRAIAQIKGELRRITFAHIDAIIRLAETAEGEKCLDLPDRIQIRRTREELIIIRSEKPLRISHREASPNFYYQIERPGEQLIITEIGRRLNLSLINCFEFDMIRQIPAHIAYFDNDRVTFPLILRNWMPGDRFSPLGMNGSQKLSDFFINHKIPKSQRDKAAVLASGKEILWIVGHRMSNHGKVTASTRTLLKAETFML